MVSILSFATVHPIWFVLISMLVSFLLVMLVFILSKLVSGEKEGVQMLALGTGQALVALAFMALIWKLGWLQAAGFCAIGGWRAWLVVLVAMVYILSVALYAYTGDLRLPLPDKKRAGLLGYQMLGVGLLEETVYRGLALYTFLRLWGDRSGGILESVALSAALFGLSHLTWALFGKPVKLTALQSLGALLGGFIYGTMVVVMGTIWPAVLMHALVNAVVNIKILPLAEGWKYVALQMPVVLVCVYLLVQSAPYLVVPIAP